MDTFAGNDTNVNVFRGFVISGYHPSSERDVAIATILKPPFYYK